MVWHGHPLKKMAVFSHDICVMIEFLAVCTGDTRSAQEVGGQESDRHSNHRDGYRWSCRGRCHGEGEGVCVCDV